MSVASERKIVLVTRKTRLEDLIAKYLTPAQARFYVEHLGADFSDYQREHDVYLAARHETVQALEQWGRYQIIERGFLPNFSSNHTESMSSKPTGMRESPNFDLPACRG